VDISLLMIVRALHILLAALWLGTAVLLTAFVMPALRQTGMQGAPLMARIAQRGLAHYITALAVLSALTGLWLYWRVTNGLQAQVMLSTPVVVLGIGALAGLLAAGMVVAILVRSMKAMGRSMGAAKTLPEGEERNSHLQRICALQRRFARYSKLVVTLMLIALLCMTLSHVL
jgi:hypothetical protein